MPVLIRGTILSNVSKNKRFYKTNSPIGQLSFENGCQGWEIWNPKTLDATNQGFASTLASGLTECCVAIGRGKVLYIPRGDVTKSKVFNQFVNKTQGEFPEEVKKVPLLLYIDFVWDERSQKEWYDLPHWARHMLLNARANAISSEATVMPINVSFEADNYPTILFNESLAVLGLYHNASGDTYLGWISDISRVQGVQLVKEHRGSQAGQYKRAAWICQKAALAQFKQDSGPAVARELARMYKLKLADSIWIFKHLMEHIAAAHDAWKDHSGYTMEGDAFVGPQITRMYRNEIRNVTTTVQGGDRLQQLRNEIAGWSQNDSAALQDFVDEINSGSTFGLAMFTIDDEGWNSLSMDRRRIAVEYARLEHEAEMRAGTEQDEEDEDADDDGEEATDGAEG